MKINPINNNYNFTGTFKYNKLLKDSLMKAGDNDLLKFNKMLDRMNNCHDFRKFELVEDKNAGSFFSNNKTRKVFLEEYMPNKKEKHCVDTECTHVEEYYSYLTTKNIIKNVNNIIEKIYPDGEKLNETREFLLKDIFKKLKND